MLKFPKTYIALRRNQVENGIYSLRPIRYEDRHLIRKWRNNQIFHLRQSKKLSKEDQDAYFQNEVLPLFNEEQPKQLLFSFFKKDRFVAYGGLVHINWIDRNAEVSFVIDTSLEQDFFMEFWENYLALVKVFAFKYLDFRKIFTYAFDLRPRLYTVLDKAGFFEEARLKDHCFLDGRFYDVLYHSFFNPRYGTSLREAEAKDCELIFTWANDRAVRINSNFPEPIIWENHKAWFQKRLNSRTTKIFIFQNFHGQSIGQLRLENIEGNWLINYSLDINYRGLGIGKEIVKLALLEIPDGVFRAQVKKENISSSKVFKSLGFTIENTTEDSYFFKYKHE